MSLIPEKNVSLAELRRNNGDRGSRMWVAHQGVVYDVTDCPKWRKGIHENQHFPGQDLTEELENDAPHNRVVFQHPCIVVVGRLTA